MNVCSNHSIVPQKWTDKNNGDEACEHVNNGADAVHIFREDDSFGPVFIEYVCAECRDRILKEIDGKMVNCDDCKKSFKKKDTTEYRWYGFYAPQGDEPYILCDECRRGEKHKKRLEQDRAERKADEEYEERQRRLDQGIDYEED